MATVTGTTLTYGVGSAGGNREDLADRIYDLFPDDTFFLTNLEKTRASSTLHEWLGDTIVAANTNINREGYRLAFYKFRELLGSLRALAYGNQQPSAPVMV